MGLQASGLSTINKTTQALTLIKQDIGQKIYINKRTQQQYMLISRLINEGDESIQQSLIKRKSLQSQYIPSLLHYGKETQNYCSNITTMHILFKHPSKSLAEEQVHRLQAHQWFLQGQILMISFCILNALQEYRKLYDNYQIVINQNTIFIQICGNIILSDSDSYKDKPLKRLSLRRISMQRFRMAQRAAMTQLSMVLERLMNEKDKIKDYSDRLGRFTNLLRKGQFNSYEQAIIYLNNIKDKDRTSSKRRSKNTTTIQQISNISSSSNSTPIQQLIKISDVRQPLAQIKLNNNHIPKKIQFISTKKRQTKLKTFKTQFQNKKQQAFAQQKFEHIFQEEGLTLRIDEISSIHQRNSNRLTQQDDAQPLPIFYDNYLIQDSLSSMQSLQLPTNKIELFNNNQPLKLQQLVLNQKGIIYEESADELQSMASQRTFRRKNIQYYNQ